MSLRGGDWTTLKFLNTLPSWFGAFYIALCQHQEDYKIDSKEEFLCWKLRDVFEKEASKWALQLSELRKEQIDDLGRKTTSHEEEVWDDDRTTGS